ncbi:polysaccharide pyruvyl transferase family protein [Methanothermobacter sp. KEPCO-1]|uniref:polysaccharide pyruvyl transferase family protein n=1 Tax=Methanothermobacter TaxID=145260 RepID=UPI0011C94FFD|nr:MULTISPECIES: polysaccharide pyruvyl transferase family protein [unclassified Methanothermobacter]QEF93778.1 polysaccharide pyruvyl transferase family protein [Methanothermobacter sp. KEPCO-1]
MDVLVMGYYGWNNTGDDAMLYSLLDGLKETLSDVRFNITAASEPFLPGDLDVRIVPPGISPALLMAFLRSSMVILGGGTHFFDYGKTSSRIMRLAQILIMTLTARLTRKRVYFMGVGIERPVHRWSKFLIKNTCRLASKIVVRDSNSMRVLSEMGVNERAELSHDLSFFLKYEKRRRKRGLLGVSAMPYFRIYGGDEKKDELLVRAFADAIRSWLALDDENTARLFIFNGREPNDDRRISMRIAREVNDDRVRVEDYRPDPRETIAAVASCDAFVAMKFHAALFAYLNDVPEIIVEYAAKNRALVEDAGFGRNAIIDLDDVCNGELSGRVEDLYRNPEDYMAARRASEIRGEFPSLSDDLPLEGR